MNDPKLSQQSPGAHLLVELWLYVCGQRSAGAEHAGSARILLSSARRLLIFFLLSVGL